MSQRFPASDTFSYRRIPRRSLPWTWLVVHGAVFLALFGVVVSVPFQSQPLPVEGQVAPQTVTARSQVTYIDTIATNRIKQTLERGVQPVYDSNVSAAEQSRQQAVVFFQNADAILGTPHLTPAKRRQQIQQLFIRSSPVTGASLPVVPLSGWRGVKRWTLHLLADSLDLPPFAVTQNASVVLSLLNTLPRSLSPAQRNAIVTILNAFLTPTLVVDPGATQRKAQEAAANVKPVTTTIPAGTVVVRRGQLVTPAILQELRALGLPTETADWQQRAGSLLFAALLIFLLFWYVHLFHPGLESDNRLLALVDASLLVTVFAAKVIVPGHVLLPYFFPVAAASTLCALLLPTEASIALTLVLSLLVGWAVGGSFELTTYYLTGGIVGALTVRNLRRLNDFVASGIYIALASLLVIVSFRLLDQSYDLLALRDFALAAGANGFLSAAIALGGFAVLASVLGVPTTLHLLDLAHPDQKLLRRMMVDAPGTYNHSLVLASMVERAARDIGANALLAKVSALYHDVGKLANPQCFIENQMGIPNIHDELEPAESARIIKGHVTQGMRLARQHRLPPAIRDAVVQHHGTMAMPFLLHRALQEDPNADAALYTYAGPRPQTKECALLMLADGCEPAVRAGRAPEGTHSPEIIRDIVNRTIDERVASGQLSECPLTLKDLEAVRRAFTDVLNGLYHPRIEYPEPSELRVPRATIGH